MLCSRISWKLGRRNTDGAGNRVESERPSVELTEGQTSYSECVSQLLVWQEVLKRVWAAGDPLTQGLVGS